MLSKISVLIITLQCLRPVVSAVKDPGDLPIQFPGPVKEGHKKPGEVPDECKGLNYCTIKPPDYPQEKFDAMFKGANLGPMPNLVINPDESFGNRYGDELEDDDCSSKVTYDPLYQVRPIRHKTWRFVVNSEKENYVQKVRLETCDNPGGKCFTKFTSPPSLMPFCKQKYNIWQVVVSDGKNGTETIETELPVCCSCHYKPV